MSAAVAGPVLREDDRGIPRSLPLLATLVDAEARRYAATAASRPAETGLLRAFRGGAAPKVPIRAFLERIHVLEAEARRYATAAPESRRQHWRPTPSIFFSARVDHGGNG